MLYKYKYALIFLCVLPAALSEAALSKIQIINDSGVGIRVMVSKRQSLAAAFYNKLRNIAKPSTKPSNVPQSMPSITLMPKSATRREQQNNVKQPAISLAQKYSYDTKADLTAFIQKMRIDDGFIVVNKTNERIDVNINYEMKDDVGLGKIEKITLDPYAFYVFDKRYDIILNSFKLTNTKKTFFLNPKFTEDGHLQLSIETTQDRHFLHQYHHFNFISRKFTQEHLNDLALSQAERDFRRDFNGSCDYLDFMAKQEGVNLAFIDQQRQSLYTKNNIATLLKNSPGLLDSATHKIPLITHKIWVTSEDDPKDPSIQYIQWLENSIEHNPVSSGWVHYFWIESREKLPKLAKMLESYHQNIKLMELNKLDTSIFLTGDLYKLAIKEHKFGKATDIIRLELLRLFGGNYLDTDYEVYQSLMPYCNAYNLVVGLEPMSAYLCNAFIGASPNHPVIVKALELIKRNLGPEAPDYIKQAPNNGFKTIIETGPAMFTIAFALGAGQGESRDIVLPPQTIYPAISDEYPKKQVVRPDGKIPAQAVGAHYWNTAWMDPRFGSKG